MKTSNSSSELKMAFEQKKPFKVFLIDDEGESKYDIFNFNEKDKIYQGQFGCLKLESVVLAINGKLPHIRLEVLNETNDNI